MKKLIINIILPLAIISCSSQREFNTISNSEKQNIMIENNSNFSNVSVIGYHGAFQVEKAKKIAEENNQKKVIDNLQNIEGISVSVNKDNSIKASLQNDILFKFNSAEVESKAKSILKEFSNVLLENTDSAKLEITGHTDNIGTKEYNQILSEARAKAVSNVLKNFGIKEENMKTNGKGFSEPMSDNKTSEGRSKNRRVEIIILNEK